MKVNHGKRNEIILLIISNVVVAALFIGSLALHGWGTMPVGNDIMFIPNTNLFLAWLPFIIVSIVQLVCILKRTPLGTLIVSALKTVIYCAVCVLAIAFSLIHPAIEITGIVTLFEAYGDLILNWTSLAAGILFLVLDIISCLVWMHGNRKERQNSGRQVCSRAEKTWLASGIIAVVLWCAISYLREYNPLEGIPAAVVFILFGVGWWIESRKSRLASVILFIILSVCVIVSARAMYPYVIYAGLAGIILTVIEAAALVIWYVFTCILTVRRWPAGKEKTL